MKKFLLLFTLFITGVSFSQKQPTVYNGTFDEIPKSSGSDCACAGWINKDIADAGENSVASGSNLIKFDNVESDGIYQEIAVEANSNYTLNFSYIFSDIPTTTTNLEIYILKGSNFEAGYTPTFDPPATIAQDDLGYRSVAAIENATNQLAKSLIVPPTHESASIASLTFDTGTETSIAIFVRAVGPYDAASHGDAPDDKGWMNGDSEVRIDNLTLVNNGLSITATPNQPTVYNGTFDEIPKSSGSDCACAGWINKNIADAGENSVTSGSNVIKFDNIESDGIYQEIAVEANSNYTLNFSYIYSLIPTTTTNLEIYILKGSNFEAGYTPTFDPPATIPQDDLGYRSVADIENATNQLAKSLIVPPTHESASIALLNFDTGTETSIAIFVRAVGPYDAASHGDTDDDKGWMNGDSEVRIDNLTLVNNGFSNNDWLGTTTAWNATTNWSLSTLPTTVNRVIISNTGTNPIIGSTTGAKAYNLNINAAAALNISSGGSLIVDDVSFGDITYNRTVSGDNIDKTKDWHLVSSPLNGETIQNLRTNNTFATSDGTPGRIAISTYNNTDEDYDYLTDTSIGSLVNGRGYSTRLAAAGDISFTGTLGNTNVPINLTVNTNGFNLLGNPFPSYLNSKTFLEDVNNTTEITNQQIWVWDSSGNAGAGEFIAKPKVDEFQVAPGQGFFVEAAVAGEVIFDTSNQSHQTDTFEKSNEKTEIHLNLKDGTNNKFAKIYFINNTTKGFDNGFEGELFRGIAQDFKIFTQLIDNNGKNYQVQSLPKEFENLIIPVGVKASANKEIVFSTEVLNLPSELKVFLEDRLTNTFTRLDEANTTYKVTLTDALNGVGRFYLHTSSKNALSVDDNLTLNNISIYKTNASTLKIVGLQEGNTNIKVFNILGKQLINSSFKANGVKSISLPELTTGIYIVQLKTEAGTLMKKIILE